MQTLTTSRLKTVFYALFSMLYAYRLASIPSYYLSDRTNYAIWYEYASDRLETNWGTTQLFFMEPLYYLINKALSFLNDPNLALQIIAFFICFNFCFFALNFMKKWYASILFLLLLFFVHHVFLLQLNALRQGVAVAFLFCFIQFRKEITYKNMVVFCCVLGLFHLTFFLIAGLIAVDWWIMHKPRMFQQLKRISILVGTSVALSIFALSITTYLGAKQSSSIAENEATTSGLGFLFFLAILLYIWFMKPQKYEDSRINAIYIVSLVSLLFYLASYFFLPLLARILSTALPFTFFILLYKPKVLDFLIGFALLFQAIYRFFYTDRISVYFYRPINELFEHVFGLNILL